MKYRGKKKIEDKLGKTKKGRREELEMMERTKEKFGKERKKTTKKSW